MLRNIFIYCCPNDISLVPLGNQYLHKTADNDIVLVNAEDQTLSEILKNSTLVCLLTYCTSQTLEKVLLHVSLCNQCVMFFLFPFVDRPHMERPQLFYLLTKNLLFFNTTM